MKQTSLREFQLRASAYLKELPVVLTHYNLPRYIVLTLEEYRALSQKNVLTVDAKRDATLDDIEEAYVAVSTCEAVINGKRCGEPATAIGKMWSEEEQELVDVPMCKKHALASLREIK